MVGSLLDQKIHFFKYFSSMCLMNVIVDDISASVCVKGQPYILDNAKSEREKGNKIKRPGFGLWLNMQGWLLLVG